MNIKLCMALVCSEMITSCWFAFYTDTSD